MGNQLDFYLTTCEGLHDFMWQTASNIINAAVNLSWKLFPFLLFARFAIDEGMNRYNGVMDFKVHVKTIFTAILITFFLANYKWILERFDDFISVFHFSKSELLDAANKSANTLKEIAQEAAKGAADKEDWYKSVNSLTQYIYDKIVGLVVSGMHNVHKGCIYMIHYSRVYLLLLASLVGPLAAIGTLLPGFMRSAFSIWCKSYVHISCWGITLNIFKAFTNALEKAARDSNFLGTTAYIMNAIALTICIFLTPIITSKFVGSAITPNVGNAMSQVANRGSKMLSSSIRSLVKGTGKLVGASGKLLGALGRLVK